MWQEEYFQHAKWYNSLLRKRERKVLFLQFVEQRERELDFDVFLYLCIFKTYTISSVVFSAMLHVPFGLGHSGQRAVFEGQDPGDWDNPNNWETLNEPLSADGTPTSVMSDRLPCETDAVSFPAVSQSPALSLFHVAVELRRCSQRPPADAVLCLPRVCVCLSTLGSRHICVSLCSSVCMCLYLCCIFYHQLCVLTTSMVGGMFVAQKEHCIGRANTYMQRSSSPCAWLVQLVTK